MARSLRTVVLIAAAATVASLQVNATSGAGRGQQPPGRPMPPDLVAPAGSQPQAPSRSVATSPQVQPKPAQAAPVVQGVVPKAQTAAKTGKRRGKKPAPQPEPAPVQPDPGPPPPPPTPQQMEPSPPSVTFGDGLLTISAANSTLADVLAAVRKQTGASIEVPPGTGRDRVFAHIGPASPRDAVTALLNGSGYDYVIVGEPDDPRALRQVLLTPRSADGSGGGMMSASPVATTRPQVSRLPGMGEPPGAAANNNDDDDDKAQAQPQVTPQNPAAATPNAAQPVAPAAQPSGQTPVQPGPDAGNAQQAPKTPQQYLDELNRIKQQEQKTKPPAKPNQ